MDRVRIRPAEEADITQIASVHAEAFPRQGHSKEWISCQILARPMVQIFIAETEGKVLGYATWTEKSGFRPDAVIELSQIAVLADIRGQGIGEHLIRASLADVEAGITLRGDRVAALIVTTSADNRAMALYRRALGVEPVATIEDLFAQPEVALVRRKVI